MGSVSTHEVWGAASATNVVSCRAYIAQFGNPLLDYVCSVVVGGALTTHTDPYRAGAIAAAQQHVESTCGPIVSKWVQFPPNVLRIERQHGVPRLTDSVDAIVVRNQDVQAVVRNNASQARGYFQMMQHRSQAQQVLQSWMSHNWDAVPVDASFVAANLQWDYVI